MYKCNSEKCGYEFVPHSFLIRHPNKIRCLKCESKCTLTEKGRELRKQIISESNCGYE